MKKIVSLVMMVALLAALACPALATEFVPSISDKGSPELVTSLDENGNVVIGKLVDENGNAVDDLHGDCLVITAVSRAKKSDEIPADAKEELLDVYSDLKGGDMEIPYATLFAGVTDADKLVVRDLFDVSWICSEHPDVVAPKGVYVSLTFKLGVSADTDVYVASYKNDTWNKIVSVTNNGDGTVTCVFEDFCPVAFIVPAGSDKPPVQTGDTADLTLWIVLMSVSAVALAAVVVFSRRKNIAE